MGGNLRRNLPAQEFIFASRRRSQRAPQGQGWRRKPCRWRAVSGDAAAHRSVSLPGRRKPPLTLVDGRPAANIHMIRRLQVRPPRNGLFPAGCPETPATPGGVSCRKWSLFGGPLAAHIPFGRAARLSFSRLFAGAGRSSCQRAFPGGLTARYRPDFAAGAPDLGRRRIRSASAIGAAPTRPSPPLRAPK